MLLGLSIRNFKSIRAADVRFGPLTCVVGHNGAGKSNLFDAINFLSLLADRDVHQAALEVRKTSEGSHSPLDLVFGREPNHAIELSADMIVPNSVMDDFDQLAEPSTTLLTYRLRLRYDKHSDRLLVDREELSHAKLGDFDRFAGFKTGKQFRSAVAVGSRRGGPLISTDDERGAIVLHGDGGSRGRGAPAGRSPRTVVGGTNTADYPTVLAARREMMSWRLLQLEPSAMRTPDPRGAEPHVSSSGGHLAATLMTLVERDPQLRHEIVNRLAALNSDIAELDAFLDEPRDQVVLRAKIPGIDNWLYGRSLSDGTLRYIALTLMLADDAERGILCLEEPENGIHPSRIPSLVRLLYDYAVDVDEAVGVDNPLRQVILNTHSPEVARQLEFADMLFAERARGIDGSAVSVFRPVEGTWRCSVDGQAEGALPKDRQSVADFIGGSPIRDFGVQQLTFEFGSAS